MARFRNNEEAGVGVVQVTSEEGACTSLKALVGSDGLWHSF